MQLADSPLCGHCGQPVQGYGYAGGQALCHPHQGLDCYHLVTLYRHPTPCGECKLQISGREESP
jgi:hypothetical protein